jgi:ribosome-associated toxin RatA of RatAB toxin-antitoxin module
MRKVILDAVIVGEQAGTVFENVMQFSRYPDLSPHVQAATVEETRPSAAGSSSWELLFRSGLLQWSEEERFLKEQLRVEFEQTEGDFDVFGGFWTFQQDGDDCVLHFECNFDFGIDSLAGILDPIAERVIKETVAWAVVGLHNKVRLGGDLELVPELSGAGAAGPATPTRW